jgi:hypothetical protein
VPRLPHPCAPRCGDVGRFFRRQGFHLRPATHWFKRGGFNKQGERGWVGGE